MIERILAETMIDVEQRMSRRSLRELEAQLLPSSRSLSKALKQSRSAVILECKKASPSRGLIRPHFDMAEIVNAYDPFADAISVLTNERFFDGSHENLRIARRYTQKPLLCKDFVLTPYQVVEARFFDADAILLMMSLLRDEQFLECHRKASSLNMEVLVEVHNENELDRALSLGAQIIGVNNRDFRTLKVDLKTAERVLPLIPKNKVTVFESGISTHQELLKYRGITDAFLIGTSLMAQVNIERAVRELVFGRVKVCGLTRHEDALFAHKYGALYGGLIFAPESQRCVSLEQAREVKRDCPLELVGVFVNQAPELILENVKALSLVAVQLHGEETKAFVTTLRKLLPKGCEIWKAVRVRDEIPKLDEYGCDRILLDAFKPNQRGGTGFSFDWTKLKALSSKESYILSGGLSLENAHEADRQGLWALDVNSGVESAPGLKSESLLQQFFGKLR